MEEKGTRNKQIRSRKTHRATLLRRPFTRITNAKIYIYRPENTTKRKADVGKTSINEKAHATKFKFQVLFPSCLPHTSLGLSLPLAPTLFPVCLFSLSSTSLPSRPLAFPPPTSLYCPSRAFALPPLPFSYLFPFHHSSLCSYPLPPSFHHALFPSSLPKPLSSSCPSTTSPSFLPLLTPFFHSLFPFYYSLRLTPRSAPPQCPSLSSLPQPCLPHAMYRQERRWRREISNASCGRPSTTREGCLPVTAKEAEGELNARLDFLLKSLETSG